MPSIAQLTAGILAPTSAVLAQAQGGGPGLWAQLPLFVGFGLILYFIVIRPQQQERQALLELRNALKKGDEVGTVGGLLGKVHEVKEKYVVIEVAQGVRVRVMKESIDRRGVEPKDEKKDESGKKEEPKKEEK